METRKEMPIEELKKEKINGKPRVITEKIPDKYVKDIEDLKRKKGGLVQQFLQISVQLVNAKNQQKVLLDKVKGIDQKIGNTVDHAFKKLKLHRRKDRRWSFKRDSFVGIYNPPKQKSEEKK